LIFVFLNKLVSQLLMKLKLDRKEKRELKRLP